MASLKHPLQWLVIAIACLVLGNHPVVAAESRASNLRTVEWLQKNAGNSDLILIDASGSRLYAAKHIPGALNVDLYSYGSPHKVTPAQMEARFQKWGIGPGKKIVIYDEGGGNTAPWLFYELHYYGYPTQDLSILDGGLAKWEASGGPVTKDVTPAPAAGSFRITKVREEDRVRFADFMAATGDPANRKVVEALEASYHFGGGKFFDRAGHVPNAILLPHHDFYNPDKTFKSEAEIRKMAEYLGIRPDQEIHTHCGGGVAATVPFFAFKMLSGFQNVKVYKESQMEWLQDERGLPMWTYDAPYIKRDANWVGNWGSRMMRMYGVAQLSVVDVRPADSFAQGHVPYALNVPAETFKASLDDPQKLAAVLGPAGVDPTHEAVIVSSGGLNPHSALAFVVLEKLGQKKISVLNESLEDWAIRGLPVTKDPTIVGKPASPKDMAVSQVVYAASLRPGVMVKDARTTTGVFPKVFIASGKSVPAKAPDGKVLHVPYTDLVNADGSPKAASDIWNILVKAGVPRYAEIICYSDDPGEAAVNYVVFKLMGYPDVKLLVT